MFGKDGEQLEKLRLQRRSQYAADLKQQIDEQSGQSTFRQSAANQIIGFPSPRQQPQDTSSQQQRYQQQQQQRYQQPQPQQTSSSTYLNIPDVNSSYPESARPGYPDQSTQKIQYLIDRSLGVELPLKMRQFNDQVNSLSNKVESSIATNQNSISSLRDKINEITLSINSINQKCADNNEKISQDISNIRQENSRNNDTILQRLQSIESNINQCSEAMQLISRRQVQFEQIISEQTSRLSQTVAAISRSSANNDMHIMQQVEMLNRQTISTFTQMGQQIQSVSNVLEDSFSAFANEAKSSLELIRSESDESINYLEKQMVQNASDVSIALKSIQSEVVDTLSCFANFSKNNANMTQNVIMSTNSNRQKNEQKMLDAYNAFTVTIAEQIFNSSRTIEKLENNQRVFVEQQCASYLSTWKSDLSSFLKDVSFSVGECQKKSAEVERKLSEYVISVGKRQDEIIDLVNKKSSLNQSTTITAVASSEEIGRRIDQLEKSLASLSKRPPPISTLDNNNNNNNNNSINMTPTPRQQPKTGQFRPPIVKMPAQIALDDKQQPSQPDLMQNPRQTYQPPAIDPKLNIQKAKLTSNNNNNNGNINENNGKNNDDNKPLLTPDDNENGENIDDSYSLLGHTVSENYTDYTDYTMTETPSLLTDVNNNNTNEKEDPKRKKEVKILLPEDPQAPNPAPRAKNLPKKQDPQPPSETTEPESTTVNPPNDKQTKPPSKEKNPQNDPNSQKKEKQPPQQQQPPHSPSKTDKTEKNDQNKKENPTPKKEAKKTGPVQPTPPESSQYEEEEDSIDLAIFNDSGSLSECSILKKDAETQKKKPPRKKFGRK